MITSQPAPDAVPRPLSELLTELPGLLTWPPPEVEVTGVSGDSRSVLPGHVFVARTGDTFDGHVFIPDAVMSGAAVIVGERPAAGSRSPVPYLRVRDAREALAWLSAAWYGFPARQLTVIGVTGTDGKTTTVNLLFHILRAAGLSAGLISTVNAIIGDENLDTGLHVTTPDATDVQRYLAQMVCVGSTHAIIEATSHGLAQHRVTACEFDVAIVTNITHEHLDYHRDWEAYFAAKARLFEGLLTAAQKHDQQKLAVLNAQDASFERLSDIGAEHMLSYGLQDNADVVAKDILFEAGATQFTLSARIAAGIRRDVPVLQTDFPVASKLLGEFNVSNILAAATAALGMGIAPKAVQAGVAALDGIPGRMERISSAEHPFLAIVDFAHTPNSLQKALETAQQLAAPTGSVIAVWGCAGARDKQKRHLMGAISAHLADATIITAEDPRNEPLDAIMAEIAAALEAEGKQEGVDFWRIADRGRAIRFAVELARPHDVVIACGKGHEQSMCFGPTEYAWDDREAMRLALRGETLNTLPTAPKAQHNAARAQPESS
jgi:UDP-N-acetylmuramoyl-L-alanyl-D-glutamate--2,6-diaminopimelate ligase